MKRIPFVAAALVLSVGCGSEPDRAIRVDVAVDANLRADCIELVVSAGGQPLKSVVMERTPKKTDWVVGVRRGDDLPETVTLQALAHVGACDVPASLKVNSRSAEVQARFPEEGVETAGPLRLEPPPPGDDRDGDGYAGPDSGGPDCDDREATTFPGSVQRCNTEKDTDCDGLDACVDPDCSTATECVNPPTRLELAGPLTGDKRLSCVHPIIISLRNAMEKRAATHGTTVRLSSSLPGVTFYKGDDCKGAPITSVDIAFQQTDAVVSLRGEVAGEGALTAAADGLTTAVATLNIVPLDVASAVFTQVPTSIVAGRCVGNDVTFELRDAEGRPTTVSAATTVTLSVTPNGGRIGFSTSDTCDALTNSVLIPRLQGSASFRVYSERADTLHITAEAAVTSTNSFSASADIDVTPGPATTLAFANAPLAIRTDTPCADAELVVEAHDALGNAAPVTTATPIGIAGFSPSLSFHAASGTSCGAALTSQTLAAGEHQLRFRVSASATGSGDVTASSPQGGLTSASQSLTVTSGDPAGLTFGATPVTAVSEVCSTTPLVLRLIDGTGNPSSFTSPTAVTVSAAAGAPTGLVFYGAAGCAAANALPTGAGNLTFPANQSQAAIYFKGTRAGAFTVSASAAGGITTATLAGNAVRAGPPARLAFAPTEAQARAGDCAPATTVSAFDNAGNAATFAAATPLAFAASGPVTWGTATQSCLGTAALQFSAGQGSAAVSFRSTLAGLYSVTATAGSVSTSTAFSLTVSPSVPSQLVLLAPTAAAQTLTAGACLGVRVELRDTHGNPVSGGGLLTFGALPTGVTIHTTEATCMAGTSPVTSVAPAGAEALAWVRVRTVLNQASLVLTMAQQSTSLSLTVVPGAASKLTFTGLPASVEAAHCQGGVQLQRFDSENNLTTLGVDAVTLSAPADVRFYAASTCTGAATPGSLALSFGGGSTTPAFALDSLKSSNVPYAITATAGGVSATSTLSVGYGAPSRVELQAGGPATTISCIAQKATLKDANDNLSPGNHMVTLSAAPATGVTFYGGTGCTGSAVTQVPTSGLATADFWVSATKPASSLVVTATSSGISGTATYTITPGPAHHLALSPTSGTVKAGGCIITNVTVMDEHNNPVSQSVTVTPSASPAAGVTFYGAATCDSAAEVTTFTTPGGTAALSIRPTTAVTAQGITVTASGLLPATGSWAVTPDDASKLVFITAPPEGTPLVSGACQTLVAEVRDQHDNTVPGQRSTSLAATPSDGVALYAADTCGATTGNTRQTGTNGRVTYAFRPSVARSGQELAVSSGALLSAARSWTVVAGDANKLAWATPPPATLERFTCSPAAVVQVQDAAGNPRAAATGAVITLNSSTGTSGVTFFSDASCTTPVTQVTPDAGGSASVYLVATGSGSTAVRAQSSGLGDTPNQTVTVGPGQGERLTLTPDTSDLEPGSCVKLHIARTQSDGTTPVTKGQSRVNLTAAPSQGVNFFSDSSCSAVLAGAALIPPEASAVDVYAHGQSVETRTQVTLTAAEANHGLDDASALVWAYPLVRRGDCNLAATETTKDCTLTPDIPGGTLDRSFVIVSSSPSETTPRDAYVRCQLAPGAGSTSVVHCERTGGAGTVAIGYQVVSWGRGAAEGGVSVEHLTGTMTAGTGQKDVAIGSSTVRSNAFVLLSTTSATDTGDTPRHFPTAELTENGSNRAVQLRRPTTGSPEIGYSLQVVQFAGAVVQRNRTTGRGTASFTETLSTSVALARTFALFTAYDAINGSTNGIMCSRRLRGTFTNNTTLRFERGADALCSTANVSALSWEAVQLPTCGGTCGVQRVPLTVPDAAATATANITSVEWHRSIVFFAGQGPGGASAGLGAEAANNALGAMSGVAGYSDAAMVQQVSVTRAVASGAAAFEAQVVQFNP